MYSATWSNRVQNESLTAECIESGEVWTCKPVFVKKQENGWVTETFSTKTPHNQNYILKSWHQANKSVAKERLQPDHQHLPRALGDVCFSEEISGKEGRDKQIGHVRTLH